MHPSVRNLLINISVCFYVVLLVIKLYNRFLKTRFEAKQLGPQIKNKNKKRFLIDAEQKRSQ